MKQQYTLKDDGFRGIWFEGNEHRDKAVIYMSGAKCGEKIILEWSKYLRYAYDTSEENEASRIKVENMKSDLLIMAPDYDDCWPSERAVPRIERILHEKNYPYRVKAIVYKKASHAIGMDISYLMKNPVMKAMSGTMGTAEKKYPAECEAARKDSMKQILDFLEEW